MNSQIKKISMEKRARIATFGAFTESSNYQWETFKLSQE